MQGVHLPDVRSEGGGEQKPILQWPPCCISPNSVRQNALGFFTSFDDWMHCYKGPLDALERAEDAKGYELAVQAFQEVMQSPVMRAEHDAYFELLGLSGDEKLQPVIPGTDCFNPVLKRFWEPWAR